MTELDGIMRTYHEDGRAILSEEFKIAPERSQYVLCDGKEYTSFAHRCGLDSRSLSIYLPRHLAAIINQDSEFVASNFLHEYFGHGLYCEYSSNGQRIVNLERELALAKGVSMQAQKRLLEETADAQRPTFEGFAIWLEGYLAGQLGLSSIFEKKLSLPENLPYRQLHEFFEQKASVYGKPAMLFHLGFPRLHDAATLTDVLTHLYPKESKDIELCLLYGSKKPYSDIDLFVVSDSITSDSNEWLDINARSRQSFEDFIEKLDISVTDPLITGEPILDPLGRYDSLRRRVLGAPITSESVLHNTAESERKRRVAESYPADSAERWYGLRIAETHRIVAETLREGRKLLTLEEITRSGLLPNIYKCRGASPS